jgi:hypothetical protein
MEVHHHPHVEKKNFKEYFFEFLMIFLAVTMGFFAESLREDIGDSSKEHEYMLALNIDLLSDSINLITLILAFNSRIDEYDSVINMLRNPEAVNKGARLYYLARVATRGTVFEDNNNTMIQLNISGNFRLVRNKDLAKQIVAYQNDIDDYKRINENAAYEARALYGPQSKIFNAFIFNDMSLPITDSSLNFGNNLQGGFRNVFKMADGNPQLLTHDKEKINDFVYFLHQLRSTFAAEILMLYKQKKDAVALSRMINNKYHLENE